MLRRHGMSTWLGHPRTRTERRWASLWSTPVLDRDKARSSGGPFPVPRRPLPIGVTPILDKPYEVPPSPSIFLALPQSPDRPSRVRTFAPSRTVAEAGQMIVSIALRPRWGRDRLGIVSWQYFLSVVAVVQTFDASDSCWEELPPLETSREYCLFRLPAPRLPLFLRYPVRHLDSAPRSYCILAASHLPILWTVSVAPVALVPENLPPRD